MCSFCAASWTASEFQHLFRRIPLASSRVTFSGHWHSPSPCCRLARVRKHISKCENEARCPPCSSMLHHREIIIEHTYRILTLPVCIQLHDSIWDAEQGVRLVETALQVQAGTSSCSLSPPISFRNLFI